MDSCEVIDIFGVLKYLKKYDLKLIANHDEFSIDLYSKDGMLFVKKYGKSIPASISKFWLDKEFVVLEKEVSNERGKKTFTC